jgi:elongation factor Ts
MANITAQDINKLRKMTGVGVMDCKQALTEAEGDFDKAIEILRKKGQKVANKRADRETSEGIAIARTSADHTFGIAFVLTCETDFVAKGDDFIKAANDIMDVAMNGKFANAEELNSAKLLGENQTVGELVNDLLGRIQEKIEIASYTVLQAEHVTAYTHHNKKICTLVSFNKSVQNIEEAGKDVAMQIAAMAPVAIDENSVSPQIIEKELEIARDQIRQEGKPEEMVEKIAQGKLNKFFKESTLLSQSFIKDGNMSVKAYLQSIDKDLTVTVFHRLTVS